MLIAHTAMQITVITYTKWTEKNCLYIFSIVNEAVEWSLDDIPSRIAVITKKTCLIIHPQKKTFVVYMNKNIICCLRIWSELTFDNCSPNSSSLSCKGVLSSFPSAILSRIFPIWVFSPVPTTTPTHLPAATFVPCIIQTNERLLNIIYYSIIK